MAKRKHEAEHANGTAIHTEAQAPKKAKSNGATAIPRTATTTIQIVAGSYDRVLHGITAAIHPDGKVDFADSFLFTAHTSAIRCLALSPPSEPRKGQTQKIVLATGGRDERINLYNLSAHPPRKQETKEDELLNQLAPRPVLEDASNRELGTLLHHSSTITRLAFPTRTKLLSSSEDSAIAITRTRDWSLLCTIKVPKPKVFGRPSGDTAASGGAPSGVNDFAIHPSMKTMISVSKGERCMRLWNLLTGKKAGVLNFDKAMLQEIGELRSSTTGEAQHVAWGSSSDTVCEFAVGFDRGILVFGMDSQVKCAVMAEKKTRIHAFQYLRLAEDADTSVLAVATEDGFILFYSTEKSTLEQPAADSKTDKLPRARLLTSIGGRAAGVPGRIKDFVALQSPNAGGIWYIVTGCSDGSIMLWQIHLDRKSGDREANGQKEVGKLLGTYATQNRVTCLDAFIMIPRASGEEDEAIDLDEALVAESSGASDEE